MRIAAVVQARMSSRRLPGKVLREIRGAPLLQYVVERLARAERAGPVIVATSYGREDDAVAAFCERRGLPCHRGPLDDVASRFLGVATEHRLDAIVRVSADSPLIDREVVERVVDAYTAARPDLATNVYPRTFPRGESVEVIAVGALRRARDETADAYDLEHVTPFFYLHPERFTIRNVSADQDQGQRSLAVDTAEDLERLESIFARMTRPHWDYGYEELLDLDEDAAHA